MAVRAVSIGTRARSGQADEHGSRRRPRSRPPSAPEDREPSINVRVVCRVRPMAEHEKKVGTVPAASASSERKEVVVVRRVGGVRQVRSSFHFDEVLSSFTTQEEVFAATVQPLVNEVLAGYEATAFAYGQTGTGKTYTMEGDTDSEESRGLMPRLAGAVMEALKNEEFVDHSLTVSCLEIYNEELTDLLVPSWCHQKLELMDSGDSRGTCCVGLSEVSVFSLSDILDLICTAQERRRIAETRVNARSSRSHCIFTMKVVCNRQVSTGVLEQCGKLHLVDLAGSECAKKVVPEETSIAKAQSCQGSIPDQERERKNINQSLLTLGRVIAALREKNGRVPYRDSKLTRLLSDALGGSCKTVIIATISPAMTAVDETISTLTYAEQAAGIRNRPAASSLFRNMRGNCIDSNPVTATGTVEWAELDLKVGYLTQELEEAQNALARKQQENQELLERAESAEAALENVRDELKQAQSALDASSKARAQMTAESHTMAAELDLAVGEFAVGHEISVREMVNLKEQRASEERIIALLREQREALQVDLSCICESLRKAKAELLTTRSEAADLKDSQGRSRERILAAIRKFASSEISKIGKNLDDDTELLCGRLDSIQALTSSAEDAASVSDQKNNKTIAEVTSAVSTWQEQLAAKCDSIDLRLSEGCKSSERWFGTVSASLSLLSNSPPEHNELRQKRNCMKQETVEVDGQEAWNKENLTWDCPKAIKRTEDRAVPVRPASPRPASPLARKAAVGSEQSRALRDTN